MGTTSTAPGSCARTLGMIARTSLATSTAFEPARRNTPITTVAEGTLLAAHPEAHVHALVLQAVFYFGDVLEVDGRAVALADDEIVVVLGLVQLALRLQQKGFVLAVKLSGAGVAGAVLDGRGEIVDGDVSGGHGRRIGLDAHGRLRAEDSAPG